MLEKKRVILVKLLQAKLLDSFLLIQKLNVEFQALKETFGVFELEFFEHFQEIRRQIDLHREEVFNLNIRDKLDEMALKMIEKTKHFEREYFKSLNEKLKNLFERNIELIL